MSEGLSFFLDADKARSVFALLFSFSRDEVCEDDSLHSYENTMSDILLGASLPVGVFDKLRAVYESIMKGQEGFEISLERCASDFETERDVLILVLRILIRLSNDDGYICSRDRQRMSEVLMRFDLTHTEYEAFTEAESHILSSILDTPLGMIAGLSAYYEVLGCAPEASDDEVRRRYRRLAKKYHPDRKAARMEVTESDAALRARFEEIQNAYEQIRRCRERG